MSRACIVCGKVVANTDVQEHLANNHLGPHYFWVDAREYRTMSASMLVADIKKLADLNSCYQFYEDRNGESIPYSDGVHVDMTQKPHFYAVPPATMFG